MPSELNTNPSTGTELAKEYEYIRSKYREHERDSQPLSIIPQFYYLIRLKLLDRRIINFYQTK